MQDRSESKKGKPMAKPTSVIRVLLVLGAVGFFTVQLRMFFTQTNCSERIDEVLAREQHWEALARSSRKNYTALQAELSTLRAQVKDLQLAKGEGKAGLQTTTKDGAEKFKLESVKLQVEAKTSGNDAAVVTPNDGEKDDGKLVPGLRKLPPRLRKNLNPGDKASTEKAAVVQHQQESPSPAEDEEKLVPGLRKLPPRLQKRLNPGDKASTEKAAVVKPQQESPSPAEDEEKLVPGLRKLPPRLHKRLNPGDKASAEGLSAAVKKAPVENRVVETNTDSMAFGGLPPIADIKSSSTAALPAVVAAVVVMTCNRPDYLERTLKSVLKVHNPLSGQFPLFISQDGVHEATREKAQSFPQFLYMQHVEVAPPKMERANENLAYYRIAEHYKWALTQLFNVLSFPRVIILEDDMDLAPDFFSYFEATADLLDTDDTLLAVSSWNDNGQEQFVSDPGLLYRSDFFPGLGWMLRRALWDELESKWPKAYWDDWLRLEANRRGRQTIRPEICRTYNFGETGSSNGQYFGAYLRTIRLNDVMIEWTTKDLSYLLNVNYPDFFVEGLHAAQGAANAAEVVGASEPLTSDVFVGYTDERDFQGIAKQFGVFEEWKDGVPRTGYKGVVVFRFRGKRQVYLVGPNSMTALPAKPPPLDITV
eukprot:TRINITY_DN1853_c0_g1_i1.p1 TRINITY_DN1853_c0_g1~~TRINITY_DN1853_c0_g1_i1.p1  ORF type:complete len:649 (-),score=114.62 TRINITY_DN1853_c0_g1_i1:396-2342(-)